MLNSYFALPFALYMVKNKPPIAVQAIFHIAMLVINCIGSNLGIIPAIIYSVSVIAVAYIIVYFYNQKLALPNFIMCVAVSLCVIVFIALTIMKTQGIDFEQSYIYYLDQIKLFNDESTKYVLANNNGQLSSAYIEMLKQNQELIPMIINQMKVCYSYTIITVVMSVAAFIVIIFNAILRRKNKTLSSIKELIQFRLSKIAVFIFMISTFFISSTSSNENVMAILQLNLVSLFLWIFKVAGGLGLIGLIKGLNIGNVLKIVGYIGVVIAFNGGLLMYVLIIFSCLDAFFNFRKVEIVV